MCLVFSIAMVWLQVNMEITLEHLDDRKAPSTYDSSRIFYWSWGERLQHYASRCWRFLLFSSVLFFKSIPLANNYCSSVLKDSSGDFSCNGLQMLTLSGQRAPGNKKVALSFPWREVLSVTWCEANLVAHSEPVLLRLGEEGNAYLHPRVPLLGDIVEAN